MSAAILLLCAAVLAEEPPPEPTPSRGRFRVHAGWPEGITYDFGVVNPELKEVRPLAYFEEVYLEGRIGARVDVDGAAFAEDTSLSEFENSVEMRRAQFYLLGDFRLGLPLAYKFEFSVEGDRVFLNDFYLRWKPSRWVDAVDFGYITPPMGLENVISSRSMTFMEVAAPVAALAPGYRSGIALEGHWEPWRLAWAGGFYSAGQTQITGDASDTTAQFVGRVAGLPWRDATDDARFLHIGASLSYAFSGESDIRYRARPESFIAPFVVDTGDLPAKGAFQYALEAAWSDGPLLLSGELLQSYVNGEGGRDNANFGGFYALASWMITGESHPYNTSTGMFQRLMPSRSFSIAKRQWGALEIGERLSWIDLSDGPVVGGEMLTLTSGITWHLNAEFRLFANYVYAHVTRAPEDGDVSVFQIRVEIGI